MATSTATNSKPTAQPQRPPMSKRDGTAQALTDLKTGMRYANTGQSIAQAGRLLFGDGSAPYLSATQIMGIMKTFGVEIPKGVQVTVDVAQIIIAGGAIASDVAAGAAFGAYVSPTAAGVRAVEDILVVTGALAKDESTRENLMLLNSVLDIAMIISSWGTNIYAWADLAKNIYDTTQLGSMLQAKAEGEAHQDMQNWYMSRVQGEHQAIIQNIADYNNGVIDTFDFVDRVGQQAPDFFLKVFPNFSNDVLKYVETVTFSVSEESDFLGAKVASGSGSASMSFNTVKYDRKQMISLLLKEMVNPLMQPYARFSRTDPQLVDVKTLALMATLPPYIDFIPKEFDMGAYLKLAYLTPGMLGDNIVKNHVQYGDWTQEFGAVDTEAPITYAGVEFRDPAQQSEYDLKNFYDANGDEVIAADVNGDIDTLLKYPGMANFLDAWGDIPDLADPNAADPKSTVNIWRYPMQFYKALQVLEEARKSNILSGVLGGDSQAYAYMGHLADFKKRHQQCVNQQAARAANRAGLAKIATFFGTTSDKLKMKNPIDTGQAAQFSVIR